MGDSKEFFQAFREFNKKKNLDRYDRNVSFLHNMNIDYEDLNHHTQFNLHFGNREILSFYPTKNKWIHRGKTYFGDAKKMWDWVGMMEEK